MNGSDDGFSAPAVLELSGAEIGAFDDTQVLETLAMVRRVRARADAIEAHALARLNELRGGARGTADEAGYELRVTRHAAESRIKRAQSLLTRQPKLLNAMSEGSVEGYAAGCVTEVTAPLPDDLARAVDERLSNRYASAIDPVELRRAARRAVLEVDPDGARRRALEARSQRRVELLPGENSMSALRAILPAEIAARAYASIDGAARSLRRGGEERSLDQLRADILAERLTGTSSGSGGGALVYIHVPLDAALSMSDDGCEIEGYGPIPGPIARQIMADPESVWRKVVCDPGSGAVLDLGRSTYQPSKAIRDVVMARDRECTTPGCHRSAAHTDFDHVTSRRRGGATSVANGAAQCEWHNNLKEQPGWSISSDPDSGTTTISTPTGRSYSRRQEPILRPRSKKDDTGPPANGPPEDADP